MKNQLIIGNKNYSSWSLRPWLLLKQMQISFEEVRIPLYAPGSKDKLLEHSPTGKVPALNNGDTTVWDSLAICEYINDANPDKPCWPEDINDRAFARAISHEMHSGFFEIRNVLPMNCKKNMVFNRITPELQADIDRVCQIWQISRAKYAANGPFLLGQFSIADAMFAPVVLRFNSYGITVGATEQAYMDAILSLPTLQSWIAAGIAETEIIAMGEVEE
ncbi:MAG: glutathione S-transferase [Phenylobacterium sp.]|jgi:glutathione S-transferase